MAIGTEAAQFPEKEYINERKKEYLFIFLRHLQAHGIAIGTEFDVNTLVGGYVYIVHHVKALERHKQRICDLSVVLFYGVPGEEGWPDMAIGLVLLRKPYWVQSH